MPGGRSRYCGGANPIGSGTPGCVEIHAYRAARDPRLFFIHSRWANEAAFEIHATLPNTVAFVARMEALIDHPFEATRARLLDEG